ncbi:hypothetical protein L596_005304 [Steinernema carpocapsae]|uniref:Uncharacterized protein n=1 Tax=Steinernema carpocapsae TaxID=34508 RepID=A0A4U8V2Y6_STECR|nr:hypothetical protein L596_005304 [Steinernema carpocapsae]
MGRWAVFPRLPWKSARHESRRSTRCRRNARSQTHDSSEAGPPGARFESDAVNVRRTARRGGEKEEDRSPSEADQREESRDRS